MRTNTIFLLYVVVRHFYCKNLTGATPALLSIFYATPFFPPYWAILVNFRSQNKHTYQVWYQMKADNLYIANIATKSGRYTHIYV